tara:strand:+ start:667 stop:1191 length:525 start_codon:yes stop_codon:yes gene_type:complete
MMNQDQIFRYDGSRLADDFRTWKDSDIIRLAVYAIAEHESLTHFTSVEDRFVIAEMYRELRANPPVDCGGSLEVEAYGNTYMIATSDNAQELADDIINDHADEQEGELDRTLAINGVCTTYVCFNRDMFVQDCGFDWASYLISYDGVVNEIFTKEWDDRGICRSLEVFNIWRTD